MGNSLGRVRAGRLVALLLILQGRGGTTAARLASELEVSVRTIYRDVGALQAAGVPLWTEPGPTGGVRLLDGWRSSLGGLTADEAAALFLPGPPGTAAELGLGPLLAAAEVKVMASLPDGAGKRADHVRQRFLLDAPGWFHRVEDVPALPTLARAIRRDRRADLAYRRGDATTARRIDPLGLVLKAGTWYLVAGHRGAVRTYRVSRVARARVRAEPAVRPPDFDLEAWWAQAQRDFDRSILRATVQLALSPRARRRLGAVFDPAAAAAALAAAAEPDEAGWQVVELAVESHEIAAGQLLALADGVEVLAPRALRDHMARVGAELAARHQPPGAASDWTAGGAPDKARPR
jgi:predicted DNA-binding transcriptional regulator YafY